MWKEKDRAMKSTNFYINWRKLAAFTMAICLLLVFSACGSSPQPSEELPTPSAAKELPMPEGTGAAGGQELTINMPENPQTLNPLTAQEENLCNVLSLVVEPAIKIEANGEILPSVIENWTFDAQTMTFTFVIRKNVSFHDGKGTVGADDLLFCIERICSYTEAESPYAKYKYVVGGYAKIDDTTFTVKVTEKTKDIFYFMNFPVLPKSYYESAGVDFLQKPVGTGPYQVDSYTKGEGMALSLFGDWWKTPPVFTKIDHIRNIIIRFGRRIGHVGGNLHIRRSHHEDIPRRLFDIAAQGIYRAADKIENPLRHGNIDLIQVDDNRLAGFQIIDDALRLVIGCGPEDNHLHLAALSPGFRHGDHFGTPPGEAGLLIAGLVQFVRRLVIIVIIFHFFVHLVVVFVTVYVRLLHAKRPKRLFPKTFCHPFFSSYIV